MATSSPQVSHRATRAPSGLEMTNCSLFSTVISLRFLIVNVFKVPQYALLRLMNAALIRSHKRVIDPDIGIAIGAVVSEIETLVAQGSVFFDLVCRRTEDQGDASFGRAAVYCVALRFASN